MDKIYKDTIGLTLRVNTGADITTATNTTLNVKKPDGTEVVWTASIVDTYYLHYTTIAGDLDQAGTYVIQSALTLAGWTGTGESFEVQVYDEYR